MTFKWKTLWIWADLCSKNLDSRHDTCIINERLSSVYSAEGMLLSRIPQPLNVKNDTDTTVMTKWIRLAPKIEAKRQEHGECDERGHFWKTSWESFECSFICYGRDVRTWQHHAGDYDILLMISRRVLRENIQMK